MSIKIEKLASVDLHKRGIYNWPIWEKESSVFDWTYDEEEQFYLLEGEIVIKVDEEEFYIYPGDFVTCPKG